ncbi:MAG: hypothetical protein Q9204_006326 [Flavoplaca sp. TL-2023a]
MADMVIVLNTTPTVLMDLQVEAITAVLLPMTSNLAVGTTIDAVRLAIALGVLWTRIPATSVRCPNLPLHLLAVPAPAFQTTPGVGIHSLLDLVYQVVEVDMGMEVTPTHVAVPDITGARTHMVRTLIITVRDVVIALILMDGQNEKDRVDTVDTAIPKASMPMAQMAQAKSDALNVCMGMELDAELGTVEGVGSKGMVEVPGMEDTEGMVEAEEMGEGMADTGDAGDRTVVRSS